ncbi:queuosine precursor transporter [Methylobacterium nodulans]|uniref:Probable queuosine precursor transporter n=1 Tax=Methylobacterium nodulans (strain LMG 21967 / CNCM I-2342 / ORS 2060) TaxID=460265 RepID=B8IWN8_METNO|nr:queuosine precursor transporter [Methylobacterium nodulans]ACL62929.1 conserved hypothetical protein [Methylobacterium nodulans ORS 2060]
MQNRKYLLLLAGVFCGTLVCTIILSGKIVSIFGLTFPASIVLFPATFMFGDILTEVYGYSVTRQVVWAGLISEIVWVAGYWTAAALPPAPFWSAQDAFVTVLGLTPRIAVAGMTAYVVGEFVNSYVLAKLKVMTGGRYLAVRLVGSTVFGAAADTVIVLGIAFAGIYTISQMFWMGLSVWFLKVVWELVALPVSMPLIAWLKRQENEDYYDRDTDFSPFTLADRKRSLERARPAAGSAVSPL